MSLDLTDGIPYIGMYMCDVTRLKCTYVYIIHVAYTIVP